MNAFSPLATLTARRGDVLLTPEQAAEFLGLQVCTLASWRTRPPKGGGPTFVRIGRLCKYAESDLEEFVQRGRRQNTSQKAAR